LVEPAFDGEQELAGLWVGAQAGDGLRLRAGRNTEVLFPESIEKKLEAAAFGDGHGAGLGRFEERSKFICERRRGN
jgi:hypothetical protein